VILEAKKMLKNAENFYCKKCDFTTSRQSNWTKHLSTRKHKMEANGSKKNAKYVCEICSKEYISRGSYWKHQKKCFENSDIEQSNREIDTVAPIKPDVILELLKQNQEFKELLIEQQHENQKQQEENQKLQTRILETENKLLEAVKEGTTINNNCTTNNNKFNLNFFLNEQCKNAMNISEFIDTMVLSVQDLKNTGKLGYIDGITKIFTEKLRELDTYNRPMHCTDLKRETLYIKNNDEWSKDTEDKHKIKTAIECIANKNLNNLDNWKEENPNHVVMDSKEDKEFVEIMTNSLGGMGSDREKNKQKIIKNVLKEVIVEK
jgi:hypothetical protein